eukprot:TRINITY_DN13155_c0_g1_i1.p1 TRINITY_DN13155_c0_g1~~TRINITY_DN13155_c0_g1_i1.p1  ORF type:complete len:106 (+),score=4.87 TRINITY_DN13155_c0_g1_i1:62-379(+)
MAGRAISLRLLSFNRREGVAAQCCADSHVCHRRCMNKSVASWAPFFSLSSLFPHGAITCETTDFSNFVSLVFMVRVCNERISDRSYVAAVSCAAMYATRCVSVQR